MPLGIVVMATGWKNEASIPSSDHIESQTGVCGYALGGRGKLEDWVDPG